MLEISEKALEVINKQLREAPEQPQSIRISMTEGGWRGAYLVMALDERGQDDQVFSERGLTFIVDKSVLDAVKLVRIDYVEGTMGSGFTLRSELSKSEDVPVSCETICGRC